MMKTALITGVTSGIGFATAKKFMTEGHRVIGTYRNRTDVEALERQFGDRFVGLRLDLSNQGSIDDFEKVLIPLVKESGLDVFMNNAGIATVGGIIDQEISEYYKQFEVNVFGPLKVLRIVLPFLAAKRGIILQSGSVSGEIVVPFMSAYCASKHAMEAQSDGLRRELGLLGIRVVHFQFGPVNTPIWNKVPEETVSKMKTSKWKDSFETFINFMKGRAGKGLDAEGVANTVYKIAGHANPKARYAIMKHKFSSWTLPRLLPTEMVDKSMRKALGL